MTQYDVLGIGNAIVDVLSYCEDGFLVRHTLPKGGMTLIDDERAEFLYGQMGQATECSGGSAANTLAGLSSLGGNGAFIGKVFDDQLGKIFRHDLNGVGVQFDTPPATTGKPTARCFIFVTPDAQRTMNTFIGACAYLGTADIDEALIANSQVTYIEGYLWDDAATKDALRHAISLAGTHGRKVAFTLSDTFCVERHRAEFLELVEKQLDIVFANEHEICALYQKSTLEEALAAARGKCPLLVVTRGEHGSLILKGEQTIEISAHPVEEVVDTTGAGDLYAAGFLYGYTRDYPLEECGYIASVAAATIIQQLGARSQKPLSSLIKRAA